MTSGAFPAPGETIGPYRVERRIGGGGMGVVFEAVDEHLNRTVALKVISPHLAENPDFRARFTREARAQASLDSPHVVHVYASGDDGGRLWLASQLIPDGDLGAMLGRYGAPPVRLALDLIAQVADGLADAHAAGLVHRDIKPANVLLRRRGDTFTAYLSDFGIARQVDGELTVSSQAVVGTPSYMAPELHTGGIADVQSDVYSLGCLLWACLSGQAPFGGTSDYQIVSAHLEQPVPQLPDDAPLAIGVNAVLRRAMAKEPANRYQSADTMRDELRRMLTSPLPAAAPPNTAPGAAWAPAPSEPPPPPDAGPRSRKAVAPSPARNRPLALGAGVLVLVLVLGAGVAYRLTRDDGVDQPNGSPDPTSSAATPTRSPSVSPTVSPSVSPSASPSGSGYQVKQGDEEKAVESFAATLVEEGTVNQEQANCLAFQVIRTVGLQRMVDIGMFDEQMNFLNIDLAEHPEVKDAIASAAIACIAPSASSQSAG